MLRDRRPAQRLGLVLFLALVGLCWTNHSAQGQLLPENFPVEVLVNKAVGSNTVTTPALTKEKSKESQVVHRVVPGDTLLQIARRYQVNCQVLAEANGLLDIDRIQIGQVLKVPTTAVSTTGSSNSWKPHSLPWPVMGPITQRYGGRHDDFHHGLDIAASTGTPIRAVEAGQVTWAGRKPIYGLAVIINHGTGRQTLYGHASRILVNNGQKVAAGQIIAEIGSTGRSTGPHLHFEIYEKGVTVNPLTYLK